MAELALGDLPASTRAKFADDNAATAALNAALAAARRYCGWRVSPVATEELTLDGPGGRVLDLPTRHVVNLVSVSENGTAVTAPEWSENGSVRKPSGATWTDRYRSVEVEVEHGYTEAEAADWRSTILEMVDTIGSSAATDVGRLVRKKVDDVEYQWDSAAELALNSVNYVLDSYRLHPVYFA